jgi:hypothetical protein
MATTAITELLNFTYWIIGISRRAVTGADCKKLALVPARDSRHTSGAPSVQMVMP